MAAPNAVIFVADHNVFPVAVFAAQRLAKLKTRDDVDIIVFTSSSEALESARGVDLPFAVEMVARPQAVARGPFDNPAYLRYFALNALSGRTRILYLDSDIYPETSAVFSLFDLDLRGLALAGVRDLIQAYAPEDDERTSTIGPSSRKYLNSGVLLVDRGAYERERMHRRYVDLVVNMNRPLRLSDQSALNMLLKGAWLELSPSFNMLPATSNSFMRRVFDPVITHFAGPTKPWHGAAFEGAHPMRTELEAYLRDSPWKSFLSKQFGLKQALNFLNKPVLPVGAPRRPSAFHFDRDFVGRPAFLAYLREGEFADVQQGLTSPHWENFPAT